MHILSGHGLSRKGHVHCLPWSRPAGGHMSAPPGIHLHLWHEFVQALVNSFIFPSGATLWSNVFHKFITHFFYLFWLFLAHLPLQRVFGLNKSLCTFSWLLMSLLCPFSVWRILTFTARLPSVAGTHHRSMRGGCIVFREMQGRHWLSHSQSPQPLVDAWCVCLAFEAKQHFKLMNWKGKYFLRLEPFPCYDRDVSHKVWICLFLNIFAHAMWNSSVPFLPI